MNSSGNSSGNSPVKEVLILRRATPAIYILALSAESYYNLPDENTNTSVIKR